VLVVIFIKNLYWFVFRLFVPAICYSCSDYVDEGIILCETCQSHVYPVAPLYKKVRSYKIGVYAFSKYHGPLRRMILSKKYGKRVVFYGLADLMWRQTIIRHLDVDCLVPVPLHWTRKLQRGFNQSELIAERLGEFLEAPVITGVKRVRRTKFQSSLSKEDRTKNVQSVFSVTDKKSLHNKHVIIIDDLYTTGATALSLAKEVAKCKPLSIQVVVACR
jgi:competence protein ComFC